MSTTTQDREETSEGEAISKIAPGFGKTMIGWKIMERLLLRVASAPKTSVHTKKL